MNIVYHVACGVALDVAFNTRGVMVLYSVLPDVPLLLNEYKLRKSGKKFNQWDVSYNVMRAYRTTHSLLFLPIVYLLSPLGCLAYAIHQVADWFTHTGRFSSMPFYPYKYTIKFGKDILK